MKRIFLISIAVLLFACKKENAIIPNNKLEQTEQDTVQNSDEIIIKEDKKHPVSFKNRAEELIYIREYLKTNLPKAILKNNPKLVEKAQQELIIKGYNPTLEEAAKKTIAYSNKYNSYMSLIASTKMPFTEVKKQLDNTGKLTFDEYLNKKNDDLIYIEEENAESINTSQEEDKKEIVKEENMALQNLLAGRNKKTENETKQEVTERKLLYQPTRLNHDCDAKGTIVMKLTVDYNGNVISAVKFKGIEDVCLVNYAEKQCLKLKYTPATNKENTTVFYTFNFD